MTISVVIPVYNTERYVAAAIESVLAQTRPPDEIIVVDDGSTDRTHAILRGFGARILVLRQPQSGAAAALNAGIMRSTGDLLAFQDADDLWSVDKLQLQCDLLSREPAVEAVFGTARQFISPDFEDGGRGLDSAEHDQAAPHKGSMLIRRPAFDRVGLFDPSLRYIEFVDWYCRATVLELRVQMLPDVLVLRRIHASNTGRTHRDAQRSENLLALKRLLDARRRDGRRAAEDGLQPRPDQTKG
jgi:glycosyltransferase involved in cell wall biosynthesis